MKIFAGLILVIFTANIANAQNLDFFKPTYFNTINIFNLNTDNFVTENKSKLICSIEHDTLVCTDNNFVPYTGAAFSMHKNGNLASKSFYKNGKLYGLQKTYHKNGQLKQEANFNDGKVEGLAKAYYENGQLQDESNFKDGKREGLAKSYYENGELWDETYFINDEPVQQ